MTRNSRIFLAWFFTVLIVLIAIFSLVLSGNLALNTVSKPTSFVVGYVVGSVATPFLLAALIQGIWQAISKKARAAKRFHTRLNWTTFVFLILGTIGQFSAGISSTPPV